MFGITQAYSTLKTLLTSARGTKAPSCRASPGHLLNPPETVPNALMTTGMTKADRQFQISGFIIIIIIIMIIIIIIIIIVNLTIGSTLS